MVGLAHEAVERRERAARQQLQIANRPFRDLNRGEPACVGLQCIQIARRDHEVHELASVRRDELAIPVTQIGPSSIRSVYRSARLVHMEDKKYLAIVSHYESCLERHGDTHLGVDWPRR